MQKRNWPFADKNAAAHPAIISILIIPVVLSGRTPQRVSADRTRPTASMPDREEVRVVRRAFKRFGFFHDRRCGHNGQQTRYQHHRQKRTQQFPRKEHPPPLRSRREAAFSDFPWIRGRSPSRSMGHPPLYMMPALSSPASRDSHPYEMSALYEKLVNFFVAAPFFSQVLHRWPSR